MARPLKKLPSKQILAQVKRIRGQNNKLWMLLLEFALTAKKRKVKKIVNQIVDNDMRISRWMGRL